MELSLQGRCIEGEDASVLLKRGGQYVPVSAAAASAAAGEQQQVKDGQGSVTWHFKAPQVCIAAVCVYVAGTGR